MSKRNVFDENGKEEKIQKKHKFNKKYKKKINSEKENKNNNEDEDDKDSYTQSISSSSEEEIKISKRSKSKDEYKTLPCENFIRDGCCIYKDRCNYIHDIRLEIILKDKPKKGINKNFKNYDEHNKCSFFYDKIPCTSKQNEVYEPNRDHEYVSSHRRLDVFKHLGQGKSISNYEHKSFDKYSIKSYESQLINFEYQKGYLLYSNLIKFLEDSKK